MANSIRLRTFSQTMSYGGSGSGHFGHAGRTGSIGGSKPGKGGGKSGGGSSKPKKSMTEKERQAHNKRMDAKNERDRQERRKEMSQKEKAKEQKQYKEAKERGAKAKERLKDFEKDSGASHDRAREIQTDKRGGRTTPNLTKKEKDAIKKAPKATWNSETGSRVVSIHSNIVALGSNYNAQVGWY